MTSQHGEIRQASPTSHCYGIPSFVSQWFNDDWDLPLDLVSPDWSVIPVDITIFATLWNKENHTRTCPPLIPFTVKVYSRLWRLKCVTTRNMNNSYEMIQSQQQRLYMFSKIEQLTALFLTYFPKSNFPKLCILYLPKIKISCFYQGTTFITITPHPLDKHGKSINTKYVLCHNNLIVSGLPPSYSCRISSTRVVSQSPIIRNDTEDYCNGAKMCWGNTAKYDNQMF